MSDNPGSSPVGKLEQLHRSRLIELQREAAQVASTGLRISQALSQILDQGGKAHIQPQMAFLTGALARMMKDWGVIEQLQQEGTTQRNRQPQ